MPRIGEISHNWDAVWDGERWLGMVDTMDTMDTMYGGRLETELATGSFSAMVNFAVSQHPDLVSGMYMTVAEKLQWIEQPRLDRMRTLARWHARNPSMQISYEKILSLDTSVAYLSYKQAAFKEDYKIFPSELLIATLSLVM